MSTGLLSFSKLKPGQQILGIIKTVNDFDLVLSLPNQLTGFVACDRISPLLSQSFAAALGAGEAQPSVASSMPTLTTIYKEGEVVVGTIVAATAKTAKGTKKRIEVSLMPTAANAHLKGDSIAEGLMVVGQVTSVEDRGYTVDLGLGEGLVGFLPHANKSGASDLPLGKSLPFIVSSSFDHQKSRVITLSKVPETLTSSIFKNKADVSALRCGMQVQASVTAIKSGFLEVSFCGHTGRIDILNLPDASMLRRHKDLDLAELFPVGKKLNVRLIHCDHEEKHYLLSAKETIMRWEGPSLSDQIGAIWEEATILRIDPGLGVVLSAEVEKTTMFAYCHISRLRDEHVERIDGNLKVGTRHRARILDIDSFSGLYAASLQPSILKEAIVRIAELRPGQVVRGEVTRIESYGLVVALSEHIQGLCPKFHISEVASSEQALRTYHVGQKYKFRVVDVDVKTRRITLSRKKTLLDSTLTPLATYQEAVVGQQYDGFVVAIKGFGALVRFYGDVKGIVTIAEMSDEYVDRPQDAFHVGQVVRCRVLKCDPQAKTLSLSLRKESGPKKRPESASVDAQGAAKKTKQNNPITA